MDGVNTESSPSPAPPSKKLLDQVREVLRLRRYSRRTEKAYTDWIKRQVKFQRLQSRADLADGTGKVSACLSHLAVEGHGYDIRTVQDLPGHKDVTPTQIYTHVMAKPGIGVRSPLDG